MQNKEVPVLLLTGYLGSGKTTLVNHILKNKEGVRFAVIVNDLGEINIDADLIQREGVVSSDDNNLVSLQNGCICCTLQTNLIEQIFELLKSEKFDYIMIEASGICDPAPIAQTINTIPTMGKAYSEHGICRLDNIVTIVDALRMRDEFGNGEGLTQQEYQEDDIESLLIQQIEFCNTILLNKVSEIDEKDLKKLRQIIKVLQPNAEIIECDYADVELSKLIFTRRYNFAKVANSAGWVQELGKFVDHDGNEIVDHDEEEEHEHHHDHEEHHHHDHDCHEHEGGHCHCHHHHHEEGEADEYNISTFIYFRRPAFNLPKLDYFLNARWPKSVIRAKGICYFKNQPGMSYLFEQAGKQMQVSQLGSWYVTLSEEELVEIMKKEPGLLRDWDSTYGDRMQKIVFIGQNMDKEAIIRELDACLEE